MKSMNTSTTPTPPAELSAESPATTPAKAAYTPRSLLKQLQTQFPAFRDFLPLSIGIDKQVLAALPELDRKTMRAALGIHTGSLRYLKVMEKAKQRHDLDGKPGAAVTDEHRAHATQVLKERHKKEAERKKAERDAAAAAEAARVHAEKLSQLAAKFSRKG
ncbi:ProQ/FINO family protein [Pseudoduganella danionis]|uniref:Activator of osmoprotectant transporter prop n=1 Tax=Pseudoduganella danionis TaxID=1890295 RepID=A0ABW9SK65_9BURK|nr:ProQ/FINO family protein [Pseudoduganella danionis]MTW32265.1 activator of osmoprotectant transporter prop [Pseudoduganella danionis]